MNRPLLLRLLPRSLRSSLCYRWYHSRHAAWPELYDLAILDYCPSVSMHGLVGGDLISGTIAFTGFHELELTRRLVRDAREGSVFVDVGANMGYFSLLWAGINPTGKVIAFEPSPRNLGLFTRNIELNGLSGCIDVVPKAAGDRNSEIEFEAGPLDQTGWGGIAQAHSDTSLAIPMVRLDEALEGIYIDVLKIDAEGADTLVLQGAEKLLRKRSIRKIYFEQNDVRMKGLEIEPGTAARFLESVDYRCEPLGKVKGEWIAYPSDSGACRTTSHVPRELDSNPHQN